MSTDKPSSGSRQAWIVLGRSLWRGAWSTTGVGTVPLDGLYHLSLPESVEAMHPAAASTETARQDRCLFRLE